MRPCVVLPYSDRTFATADIFCNSGISILGYCSAPEPEQVSDKSFHMCLREDNGAAKLEHAEEIGFVIFPAVDQAAKFVKPSKEAFDLPEAPVAAQFATVLGALPAASVFSSVKLCCSAWSSTSAGFGVGFSFEDVNGAALFHKPALRPVFALAVDDFVTAKAPDFNKIQQSSTSRPQAFQQESLKNNKFQ
jgi:hypothetical protein